jgi:hypothetical protein
MNKNLWANKVMKEINYRISINLMMINFKMMDILTEVLDKIINYAFIINLKIKTWKILSHLFFFNDYSTFLKKSL